MKFPWQNKEPIPLLSPLEGYDLWSANYGSESNPIKNLSDEVINKLFPDVKNKSVLDAGCGTGYFCQWATEQGAAKITGIDISPKMIEMAKRNCPSAGFKCADISTESIPKETFDVIILALVLGHIKDIRPALENLASSLKPGGTLLISDFHPFLTLRNSKRTFKDPSGKLFEIHHHLHLFQDIIQSLHQHKVMLEILEEPLWKDEPAIYAMKAKKK